MLQKDGSESRPCRKKAFLLQGLCAVFSPLTEGCACCRSSRLQSSPMPFLLALVPGDGLMPRGRMVLCSCRTPPSVWGLVFIPAPFLGLANSSILLPFFPPPLPHVKCCRLKITPGWLLQCHRCRDCCNTWFLYWHMASLKVELAVGE